MVKIVHYINDGFVLNNGKFLTKKRIVGTPCVGCNIIELDDGKFRALRLENNYPTYKC